MCAGKTTVGKELSRATGLDFISIDDQRFKYNAVNIRRERKAWDALAAQARRYKNVIVESSGLSGRIHDVYRAHASRRLVVMLTAPISVLLERYAERSVHAPFYMQTARPIEDEIERMDVLMRRVKHNLRYDTSKDDVVSIVGELVTWVPVL